MCDPTVHVPSSDLALEQSVVVDTESPLNCHLGMMAEGIWLYLQCGVVTYLHYIHKISMNIIVKPGLTRHRCPGLTVLSLMYSFPIWTHGPTLILVARCLLIKVSLALVLIILSNC